MIIQDRMRRFVADNFYVTDIAQLGDETSLIEGGYVDSTGMLEVIAFIEREFSIHIDDLEMVPENLETIGKIAAFVTRKQGAKARAG
jgi:acyl carrier protein